MANPKLPELERAQLAADLMRARREVGKALRGKDLDAQRLARQAVDAAKRSLGESGPPWWTMAHPTTTGVWCAIRPTRDGMQRLVRVLKVRICPNFRGSDGSKQEFVHDQETKEAF
jgi:hypothetical protein